MTRGLPMALVAGALATGCILLGHAPAWSDGLTAVILSELDVGLFIGEYRAAPGSAVACGGVPCHFHDAAAVHCSPANPCRGNGAPLAVGLPFTALQLVTGLVALVALRRWGK